MLSVAIASAESVEQMFQRARPLVESRSGKDRLQARQLLEAAAVQCDINASDPACADAYDWLGMVTQSATPTQEVMRDVVEPLYRKGLAVRRVGPFTEQSMALSLELEGMALNALADPDDGHALLERAAEFRKKSVLLMRSPEMQAAPANPPRHVGGAVSPPKVVYRVEPAYTHEARLLKYTSRVALRLVVDAAGAPRDITLVKSAGLGLDEQAVKAVQTWKFEPGKLNGEPVSVIANIEVNFRLL